MDIKTTDQKLPSITLSEWMRLVGNPYSEMRGQRKAVNTQLLTPVAINYLFCLSDYKVWAVCGPFIELVPALE